MPHDDALPGQFEMMVMLALLQLDNRAYGAAVRAHMEARTARAVSYGALYVTFDRLEDKGWVQSEAEPAPGRGGRPRRYVTVTAAGKRALAGARRAMDALWEGVDAALDHG